jgi:hypothetical protein
MSSDTDSKAGRPSFDGGLTFPAQSYGKFAAPVNVLLAG